MAQNGVARDIRESNGVAQEDRVRERAYRLWQEEGCPEGRADAHRDMACELVAIEAVRNLSEFLTLTDQGEQAVFLDRALAAAQGCAPRRREEEGEVTAGAQAPTIFFSSARKPGRMSSRAMAKATLAARKPTFEPVS